ncbi:DegT/DnrJ/EryC1/StrS family aminotransferase [Pelagibacteraceae bacterium]|nr:DegT/DnrJ/EryC1/StrS family aminotransferase [Pelagibacteraceae bacterium]
MINKVRYSYLPQQFEKTDDLWASLKDFVKTGDFTLGKPLQEFEEKFASLMGTKYAVGVNSGTDAIKLSLKALGIGPGDEVITAANTFVATVGAISEIGAIPIFVDCDDTFCMNTNLIESKINDKTKAILPVHFTGYMTEMNEVMKISERYNLPVVEDACQSILGEIDGKKAGTWGETGAFSLHPLKNLNVWSDGGLITTNSEEIRDKLRLLRNHGLVDRDSVGILGYNSRLDTFQAVVGNWLIPQTEDIANKRISNAKYFDDNLSKIKQISIPPRPDNYKIVYHLYIVFAEDRDNLLEYCLSKGIEAKVHYPVPIYRQPALKFLDHKEGDFPVTDAHAKKIISFPCDQHLSKEEIDYCISTVRDFYKN